MRRAYGLAPGRGLSSRALASCALPCRGPRGRPLPCWHATYLLFHSCLASAPPRGHCPRGCSQQEPRPPCPGGGSGLAVCLDPYAVASPRAATGATAVFASIARAAAHHNPAAVGAGRRVCLAVEPGDALQDHLG